MKKIIKKFGGYTLVEVLIASTIFTILSVMVTNVFVSVIRIQNKITLENQIYEDARFMMDRITREIRQNTLDYEEYYRKNCLDADECDADFKTFGSMTGCYAMQFYNPGEGGGIGVTKDLNGIIDKSTLDTNTGQNPYSSDDVGKDPNTANAVCDSNNRYSATGATLCDDPSLHKREELFLISADGEHKTYIGRQKVNGDPDEYAVSMLKMFGIDSTGDLVVDQWYDSSGDGGKYNQCEKGFDCDLGSSTGGGGGGEGGALLLKPKYNTNESVTVEKALESVLHIWKGHVPISPMRTDVKSLYFYISPLEDPKKAFAETNPADGILQQPHVTVVITVQPAASELSKYFGEMPPTLTLQNTVSSRVYKEIKTFTGKNECPD